MELGQEKYKRLFCQNGKNKDKQHESGKWKVIEDNGVYKVVSKFCKYCNEKLKEEVLK